MDVLNNSIVYTGEIFNIMFFITETPPIVCVYEKLQWCILKYKGTLYVSDI